MNMFKKILCAGMVLVLMLSLGFAAMALDENETEPLPIFIGSEVEDLEISDPGNNSSPQWFIAGEDDESLEVEDEPDASGSDPSLGSTSASGGDLNLEPIIFASEIGEDITLDIDIPTLDDDDLDIPGFGDDTDITVTPGAFAFPGYYTGTFVPIKDQYIFTVVCGEAGSDIFDFDNVHGVTKVMAIRDGNVWTFSADSYGAVEFSYDYWTGAILFKADKTGLEWLDYGVEIGNCVFYLDSDTCQVDTDSSAGEFLKPVVNPTGDDDADPSEDVEPSEEPTEDVPEADDPVIAPTEDVDPSGEPSDGPTEDADPTEDVPEADDPVIGPTEDAELGDDPIMPSEEAAETGKPVDADADANADANAKADAEQSKTTGSVSVSGSKSASYNSGSATGATNNSASGETAPKTGDTTEIAIYVVILAALVALLTMGVVAFVKKR